MNVDHEPVIVTRDFGGHARPARAPVGSQRNILHHRRAGAQSQSRESAGPQVAALHVVVGKIRCARLRGAPIVVVGDKGANPAP